MLGHPEEVALAEPRTRAGRGASKGLQELSTAEGWREGELGGHQGRGTHAGQGAAERRWAVIILPGRGASSARL